MKISEILDVLKRYYDIVDPKIEPLDSYDDLNFRISVGTKIYVFKVFSSRRGDASMVIMENDAMKYIESKSKAWGTPRVISPNDSQGKTHGVVAYSSKSQRTTYYLRLLTYLEGQLMGNMKRVDMVLLERLGRKLGDMDHALRDFDSKSAHRKWEWDLTQCVEEGKRYAEYIRNGQDKKLAKNALKLYETSVLPLYGKLRWRVIHSDANDYNICVTKAGSVGIFDFGDMVYSPLVHNVAIAIAYAMLKQSEPLKAAESVLKGYVHRMALDECDVLVLFPCIKARLAHQSSCVCKSAYSRLLEPDNSYISITENNAWKLLRYLSLKSDVDVLERFRRVVEKK